MEKLNWEGLKSTPTGLKYKKKKNTFLSLKYKFFLIKFILFNVIISKIFFI